ncbi:MAG TPA: hypothetical protein VFG56_02675 [Candidatus Saccharimonadales bacterium]|nr:hypothetical protein [Candidatus Saccharimonadales bacterium]
MSEQLEPPSGEINRQQKQAFIDRVTSLAPYTGQRIDSFGCYCTNFETDDGYISIYIPVIAELASEDEPIDDAVRVVVRSEEALDTGQTIVTNRSYTIHVTDYETSYAKRISVFDSETGEPVRHEQEVTVEESLEIHDLNKSLNSSTFTAKRLKEVESKLERLEL